MIISKMTLSSLPVPDHDVSVALSAIEKIRLTATPNTSPVTAKVSQSQQTEQDLMESVVELKKRNRVRGDLLTLEEIVDRSEERQISEELLDRDDNGIVDQVHREVEDGVASDNESELSAGEPDGGVTFGASRT